MVTTFENSTMLGTHMDEYRWALYGPLYMSTLQLARQNFNKSRDLFGNVRIPDMASLSGGKDASISDWHSVGDASSLPYTSLLGNPVVGIPRSGNVTFVIESSYWEVQCGPFTTAQGLKEAEATPIGMGRVNLTTFQGTTFDILEYTNPASKTTRSEFKYITKTGYSEFKYTNCTAPLRIVESVVGCRAGICDVQQMRTSNQSAATEARLLASKYTNHRERFRWLCTYLPGADMGPMNPSPPEKKQNRASQLTEQWILDPSLMNVIPHFGPYSSVSISSLPPEVFSQRLQIAMNTFWDASLGFNYMAVNATAQVDDYKDMINAPWTAVRAQGTDHDTNKYVCNIAFAVLTISISLLMFLVAAASALLRSVTRAPDILGYVSALARDDPHFAIPVSSYHSGLESARALRDVRVMIGDVRNDDEVGHIAFAASNDVDVGRVKWKRAYN